jgi:3-hydroxybutyryl-CoA dehydrogenase
LKKESGKFVQMRGIPVFRAMQVVVLTSKGLKQELMMQGIDTDARIFFVSDISQFSLHPGADAYLDLLFTPAPERILFLQSLLPATVLINSVTDTLAETNASFIRINGWNSFLESASVEAAAPEEKRSDAEKVLAVFGKQCTWLDDTPGFVTPRVVSMIINEACLALEEGVSTRDEIDTAMKLGTNYPFGPFEWMEKIGRDKIYELLIKLSRDHPRYQPAPFLSGK